MMMGIIYVARFWLDLNLKKKLPEIEENTVENTNS